MELNHAIKPALQQFAEHLEKIVLRNGAIREDFTERMSRRHLSARQLTLLEEFASVTLAQDLKNGQINWWATFTDSMKKTISVLKTDFPDLQQLAMAEMIVFTKWTIQSFHNLLNIEEAIYVPPSFQAEASDITSIPVLLAYLEHQFIPAMEEHLEASMNMPHDRMEQFLQEKAAFYIHERVPGVEIFWHVPATMRGDDVPALSL